MYAGVDNDMTTYCRTTFYNIPYMTYCYRAKNYDDFLNNSKYDVTDSEAERQLSLPAGLLGSDINTKPQTPPVMTSSQKSKTSIMKHAFNVVTYNMK